MSDGHIWKLVRYECPECGISGDVLEGFDAPTCVDCNVQMEVLDDG